MDDNASATNVIQTEIAYQFHSDNYFSALSDDLKTLIKALAMYKK
jgi:uncharacterized membrane protein YgcG